MVSFSQALAAVAEEHSLTVEDSWRQGRGAFGGLIAGAFVRCFDDEVRELTEGNGEVPALRSLRLQLREPLPDGPVPLQCSVARSGKYVTYLDGMMGEGGSLAVATGVAVRPTKSDLSFEDIEPPTVPHKENVEPWPQLAFMPSFTRHFEYRSCIGHFPFSSARQDVEIGGWVRFRDDEPLDLERVAALGDAWPLSIMVAASRPSPAASVEIGYHFWSAPDPEERWVLARNRSIVSRSGYGDQETHVWGTDGRLLMTARQLSILLG
jgi:hypothetical protein